jgi:hypothetical protein
MASGSVRLCRFQTDWFHFIFVAIFLSLILQHHIPDNDQTMSDISCLPSTPFLLWHLFITIVLFLWLYFRYQLCEVMTCHSVFICSDMSMADVAMSIRVKDISLLSRHEWFRFFCAIAWTFPFWKIILRTILNHNNILTVCGPAYRKLLRWVFQIDSLQESYQYSLKKLHSLFKIIRNKRAIIHHNIMTDIKVHSRMYFIKFVIPEVSQNHFSCFGGVLPKLCWCANKSKTEISLFIVDFVMMLKW